MKTRFILIRHGQTEWNRVERFRGRADLPLNDTGLAQAQKIAARLANEKIAAIYASPLLRALQTAKPLAEAQQLEVQQHPGLLDIDFGALEGMTTEEAQQAFPEVIEKWRMTPGKVKFPKGGSLKMVHARLDNLLEDVATKHAGETIALVSHRVVCHALLCKILGIPTDALWRIRQDNACINIFEKRDDNFVVMLMNDTNHL
ncbi:MAG: histidine phosphatase family protein [Chloroflexi bacterium]|nr:histidine phosphatase family protein [Chloroflexota bacterium]